jgi:hypothetical protein
MRDAVRRVIDVTVKVEEGPRCFRMRSWARPRARPARHEAQTVVASLLLLPTFIVGLYGQNFRDIPELHWRFGHGYVRGLIIVTTALQLLCYRRKHWV